MRKDREVTPVFGDAVQQRLTWRVTMAENGKAARQAGDAAKGRPGGSGGGQGDAGVPATSPRMASATNTA